MQQLSLIDLHCDTLYEIEKKGAGLAQNDCAISLSHLTPYAHYAQFFAAWCDHRLNDDEGFEAFIRMSDYWTAQLKAEEISSRMCGVYTAKELETAWEQGKHAAILAVEDGRILGGKLERLDELARRGVRYMTLMWNGDSCIGGSFNTNHGLTPFGKQAVLRCFELGIVPDISHASEQSAEDTLELAMQENCPVIATHSNAYAVYPHRRNLRDCHFAAIRDAGGLVGLNLYCAHLRDTNLGMATMTDIIRHLEHYLSLDGAHTVAIGGDWDGAQLPDEFSTIADAEKLAEELARLGYSDELIGQLFYQNALCFIKQNF